MLWMSVFLHIMTEEVKRIIIEIACVIGFLPTLESKTAEEQNRTLDFYIEKLKPNIALQNVNKKTWPAFNSYCEHHLNLRQKSNAENGGTVFPYLLFSVCIAPPCS